MDSLHEYLEIIYSIYHKVISFIIFLHELKLHIKDLILR